MNTNLPSLQKLAPGLRHTELLSRLTLSLDFAKKNLDQLDCNDPFWQEDDNTSIRLVDKVIVETALLTLLASRISAPSEEIRALIVSLTQKISKIARSERNQVFLLRFPHTAVSLGIAHVALSLLGDRDEIFDALLRRAMESGQVEAIERVPFRSMDCRWIRKLVYDNIPPDFDDLIPHSILATNAHSIYMSRDDAYALTHSLMYLTDFGTLPPPSLLNSERIAAMIDAGLAWHIMSEDMDLLGELLLSAAMLRRPWSPYASFAWHMLTKAWDDLGFLPGPSFNRSDYTSLTEKNMSSYAFKHLYHTNYVGGILCAILLYYPEYSDCAFPWNAPILISSDIIEKCKDSIQLAHDFCTLQELRLKEHKKMKMILSQDTEYFHKNRVLDSKRQLEIIKTHILEYSGKDTELMPYWNQAAINAPLSCQELAIVLSDAALIQSARHYNLSGLASALIDATHLHSPPSLTFLEAITFLIHQQLPFGAIGAHFTIPANLDNPESIHITAYLANCISIALDYICKF